MFFCKGRPQIVADQLWEEIPPACRVCAKWQFYQFFAADIFGSSSVKISQMLRICARQKSSHEAPGLGCGSSALRIPCPIAVAVSDCVVPGVRCPVLRDPAIFR